MITTAQTKGVSKGYGGSWVGKWGIVDFKQRQKSVILLCLGLASSAFGRLQSRVFCNRDLNTSTKVDVYKTACISTLLFGSEAWTLYCSHAHKLEAFHIWSLQCILGLTWADRIPHVEILQRTDSFSTKVFIIKRQLCWIGHVIHMSENCLPRKLFYEKLTSGYCSYCSQRKKYKDYLHSVLRQCSIPASELE